MVNFTYKFEYLLLKNTQFTLERLKEKKDIYFFSEFVKFTTIKLYRKKLNSIKGDMTNVHTRTSVQTEVELRKKTKF